MHLVRILSAILAAFVGLLVLIYVIGPPTPREPTVVQHPVRKLTEPGSTGMVDNEFNRRLLATSYMSLEKNDLRTSSGGNLLRNSFDVRNDNAFDVKDAEVTCYGYGNSGSLIGRYKRVVYEVVRASAMKRIRNLDFGLIDPQATSFVCKVTDVQLVAKR